MALAIPNESPVAEYSARADSSVASVVAEGVRANLGESQSIKLFNPTSVAAALRRMQLAPTAVNKLAGRAVLPEKTSPALVGLRALVGTLKAEQLEAFKFVLSPAQLETFTEIVGSEVADEEKKTVKR